MPRQFSNLFMRWHDLLFMHWPVAPHLLRPHIPPALELDTFDGSAWLGVVPFWMSCVGPRMLPPLPWLSNFAELNVRTYVRPPGGKPGVWFFSLDAENPIAVRLARWSFHLPYMDACMGVQLNNGSHIRYASTRIHRGEPPACLRVRYRPTGDTYTTRPGDLDDWLTNRLCLYSADRCGNVYQADIAHIPWPLRPAEAEIERNTMSQQLGFALPNQPPLCHFAKRIDVLAHWRRRVTPTPGSPGDSRCLPRSGTAPGSASPSGRG